VKTYAVDWDDTLVDRVSQVWLPDAESSLFWMLRRGDRPFVHSSRANTAAGKALIEAQLAASGLAVQVEAKPGADCYIDNLGHRFTTWQETLGQVA
jgi:hypothetical protein